MCNNVLHSTCWDYSVIDLSLTLSKTAGYSGGRNYYVQKYKYDNGSICATRFCIPSVGLFSYSFISSYRFLSLSQNLLDIFVAAITTYRYTNMIMEVFVPWGFTFNLLRLFNYRFISHSHKNRWIFLWLQFLCIDVLRFYIQRIRIFSFRFISHSHKNRWIFLCSQKI